MEPERIDRWAKHLAERLTRRSALRRGGAGLSATLAITAGASARAQETPTPLPVCTDPDRPGVGCDCATGTQNPCGDTTLVCCKNDPNGPPGSPGTCTPDSVGCDPTGNPCTSHGCRCNGGVQNNCDDGLACCPDNPGLPGGPGRCLRQERCNPPDCAGEGCACHSGTLGACDDGLVCCADDSSLPAGPGRCEQESVCFASQCQATTNPCPSTCSAGAYCADCCSGYCGDDSHCASQTCASAGCECNGGVQNACDSGLVCCPLPTNPPNIVGGPGVCKTEETCQSGS